MEKRWANSATMIFAALVLCASTASAQIVMVQSRDGRETFINANRPAKIRLDAPIRSRATLHHFAEYSFTGRFNPADNIDRDGAEKLVQEAAERQNVDPALVRAVVKTESDWNPDAVSRKGAVGLMLLIPSTAQRFGVNDLFNAKQNVEAGVKYLKELLERYNGNLQLALAAYNAGEGAVDRAHGIPAFRETRTYVQKVQNAYFRPGSGRLGDALYRHIIRKEVDAGGRIIFTND